MLVGFQHYHTPHCHAIETLLFAEPLTFVITPLLESRRDAYIRQDIASRAWSVVAISHVYACYSISRDASLRHYYY